MINMQTIQWLSSKRQFSKDGIEGQIGLYVENLDGSLGAPNFTKATLNIYVFFKADAPLKANVQSFLVNGKERESESIINIQDTAKPFLIYFNNFQVKRGIENYSLKYEVELKVDGYYSSFMFSLNDYLLFPNSESTGVIVEALESYFVSMEGLGETSENGKTVPYTKYYEIPLNIYAQDFLTKQEFQREGYILTKFIEKTEGIKEEDKKIFNLQDEEVFIITDNRIHQFAAEYEKKTYKITYDGNGGVCEGKSQITLEEGETPPTFTRNLHTFAEWSFSPSPFSETSSIPKELTKDITLYAKWNKMPVILNYDMNDKEIINSSLFNEPTPNSSAIVQITDEIPQTKDTYVFSHWIDNNGDKRVPGEILTLDYLNETVLNTTIINNDNAYMEVEYLTKNGEFTENGCITEQLIAQWNAPTYTVIYHYSNDDNTETIATKTFNYNCGKVEEVEGCSLWSFIKDNNNFDFQAGDTLPNTDIDLYSVKITEATITYKDGYDKNNTHEVTEIYYNNHPSIQHTCIGSSYHVQQGEGEAVRYYFQCWTDGENYYYPKYKYTFDVSNKAITLYAVYAQSELVRYNTLIQDRDNQIVLVGNNFVENSNNNNLCVLNTGDICATEFVENTSDDKVACIEIGYNKEIGIITFGNFIQQELLETNSSYELNLGTTNEEPNILYLGNGDKICTDDEFVLTI